MIRIRNDIHRVAPYVPGRPIEEVAAEHGLGDVIKLASNESPFEPLPEVKAAIAEAAGGINRYPDNDHRALRRAVAESLAISPESLWFGAGSGELILSSALVVGGPGTSAVYGWPSFVLYRIATRVAGAEPVEVPLDENQRLDPDAILAAVRPDTTIVYVCNPNNPTGTHLSREAVTDLIERIPDDVLVIVDEAYYEFVTDAGYGTLIPLALERSNVLVARTFSKAFGLAGLRVGYAVGDPGAIRELRKAQAPFSVSSLAQVAAMAALANADLLEPRLSTNAQQMKVVADEFASRNVTATDSETNFVCLQVDQAGALANALSGEGVITRAVAPGLLRVTIGTEEENRKLVAAFDRVSQ